MRRKDREITNREELIEVMKKSIVCRLVLNDEEYPYIVPLNFGMDINGEDITLYFHGANEGKKYDLIRKNNKATFEMECSHCLTIDDEDMTCTMTYESIIGRGIVEILPEDDLEEKMKALNIIIAHYHQEDFPFGTQDVPRTNILKLVVKEMTGKRHLKK